MHFRVYKFVKFHSVKFNTFGMDCYNKQYTTMNPHELAYVIHDSIYVGDNILCLVDTNKMSTSLSSPAFKTFTCVWRKLFIRIRKQHFAFNQQGLEKCHH